MLGEWWGELGKPGDETLVFPGETPAGYLDPATVLRGELYAAMKRAKVERVGADRREADVPLVSSHVREAGARERAPNHVAVTAPRALVAEGDDRHLRALRTSRTDEGSGADGRRVRRVSERRGMLRCAEEER
jgi:hypothetical protein